MYKYLWFCLEISANIFIFARKYNTKIMSKLSESSHNRMESNPSGQTKKSSWKRTLLVVAINLLIMAALLVLAVMCVAPKLLEGNTGHGIYVVVPDVRGIDTETASLQLSENNLKPMVIKTIFKDGCKPGEVVEQIPEGDMKVKPGRNVYLTINSYDVQKFVFPNVIQMSSRQARSFLEDSQFVIEEVIYEPYEFDDLVLKVTIPGSEKEFVPGEKYPKRTHVVLHVGSSSLEETPENDETEESFYE